MTHLYHPLRSLREGNWFKLICGASFQHLPDIRNLTLAYALAGADCIDVAADPAVIAAAREGLQAASALQDEARSRNYQPQTQPWLMVSLNDGEDPHFRKAEFNPIDCPSECDRPCMAICPAEAIRFESGVIDDRCYGCGRCIPICPFGRIATRAYVSSPDAIAPIVLSGVDAVEIHTQVGRIVDFERLWRAIAPFANRLKLVAISCPDGEGLVDYLRSIDRLVSIHQGAIVWQTDGRPMSGDIGDGATRAAIRLGQKVLQAKLRGFVQLAGGTNSHTVVKLKAIGLLKSSTNDAYVAGVAYGSYARVLLAPILSQLEVDSVAPLPLESKPNLLWQAVETAHSLVAQLKPMSQSTISIGAGLPDV
ncbi:4Fe-4S ferredoxin [Microcoleus sp. FACHB-1515]|uniref:circadian clock protein LdpA n=1 Tax=Cyanophyceae TaxID=3028117 RepID=UPI001685DA4F|nr:LdpA C-terminal domain-containing domain [Microcoleus sp. FACHB-1515]MBD2090159.1 4Fe-4S ferredoxin [Microcoleus sp. FACHB-1515]